MSLSINKKNKNSTKLSSSSLQLTNAKANATITAASTTATANHLTRKRRAFFNQHQHHQQNHQQQQQQYKRKPKITKTTSKITSSSSSLTALTPVLQATSNINVGNTLFSTLSTTITATATGSSAEVDAEVKSSGAAKTVGHKIFRTTTAMPSFKIMSYQNIIALLTVLVCGLVTVNGLKCYMCGQYNEGVGSITPCLNYSEQYAHLYLKECSKKSEKYCVVSGRMMYSSIFIYFFL